MKKLLLITLTPIILMFVFSGITFVIAQQEGLIHKEFVVINASQEEVWNYLSDNRNAASWSVFFDHITTLDSDGDDIKEGGVGSVRRCYRFADESGITWDEDTVKIEPYSFRQIHTYNIQNWPFEDFNALEFDVFQTYEKLGANQTKLSFSTSLKMPQTAYAKWMFYSAKWETLRIFRVNLENIKAHIEQGQVANYNRPHPWEDIALIEKVMM